MAPLPLIRLVVFSTVILFSLITLGVAAALTATTEKFLFGYLSYAALAIATAVLTLLTLPAMIALEMMRPGGPTSMVIVEISWLGFLSILWLSTGAHTAAFTFGIALDCGDLGLDTIDASACHETSAIEAFGFLNWLILMGYVGMLLVMSLMVASRKHSSVWTSSVANAPFSAPANNAPATSLGPTSYGGQTTSTGGHPATYNTSNSVQAGTVHV
ncbi:hypothetical protein B0H19DRAFT_1055114 [Mycena capillaripes]|nr:hypothetical protein B0H19DRAFT_1055114 [Mycena capillaripes]